MRKVIDYKKREIQVGDLICLKDYPEFLVLILDFWFDDYASHPTFKVFDMTANTIEKWHPYERDLKVVAKLDQK